MPSFLLSFPLVMLGILLPSPCPARAPAPAQDSRPAARSPEEILAAIDAVRFPTFDASRREDEEYVQDYFTRRDEAMARRTDLIGDLYRADPKQDRLSDLLPQRWALLVEREEDRDVLLEELEAVLRDQAGSELAGEALYARAQLGVGDVLASTRPNPENPDSPRARGWEAVEAFLAARPQDPRGAGLLRQLARAEEPGSPVQIAIYERIRKLWPGTRMAGYATGRIQQVSSIGKPFRLSFEDAISGRRVSMEDLRGKVVIVDFWATWCGPCVGEMPHMKELYAKWHDQGVAFVGISLDNPEEQGGLDKLRAFVADHQIPWPQYYQGKGWQSEFSSSWGIDSIPAVFAVDTAGNLRSVEARGHLETLIPELLWGGDDASGERSAESAESGEPAGAGRGAGAKAKKEDQQGGQE